MKKLRNDYDYLGTQDILMRRESVRDTREAYGTRVKFSNDSDTMPRKWSYLLLVFVIVCLSIIAKTVLS